MESDCMKCGPCVKSSDSQMKTAKMPRSRKRRLSTPESQVPIKKLRVTSSDKSTTSKKLFRTTKSSPTLDRDLTSNASALKPFWSEYTADLSRRLWYATRTDCVDTESSWWNGSSANLARGSWFSVSLKMARTTQQDSRNPLRPQATNLSWLKTSCPSLMSSSREITADDRPKIDVDGGEEKMPKEKGNVNVDNVKSEGRPECKRAGPTAGVERKPGTSKMKARKIRVYPTIKQKQVLLRWLGTSRWTYNNVVSSIRDRSCAANKKMLRSLWLNKEPLQKKGYDWALETPYDVRDEAMADVLKAIKSNRALKRTKFHLKFRSRKDKQESFCILKKHWNRSRGMYAPIFSPAKLKSSEPLPDELQCDSRVIKDRLGRWYLCLPMSVEMVDVGRDKQHAEWGIRTTAAAAGPTSTPPWSVPVPVPVPAPGDVSDQVQPPRGENQSTKLRQTKTPTGSGSDSSPGGEQSLSLCSRQCGGGQAIISLDPGVRTFMTGFDPSGEIWEWGKQDIGRIYRLCHVVDDLQSRWMGKDVRHKRRYNMRKAARRVRYRIRNLIDEVHKKLAKWLCEKYDVVLLPVFETSKMIRKGQRKLRSKTARAMVTWSHYRFRQRLLYKSSIYTHSPRIILCDEAYTSKTCGSCGHIHDKLGGSKVFHCPRCNYTTDRDVNGARNILLRYMTLHQN